MTTCDRCGEMNPADIHTCTPPAQPATEDSSAVQPAPGQEPVGEVCGYYERGFDAEKTRYGKLYNQELPLGIKLYTTPPAQEIVCSTGLCHYKAQPAVPMTDEQIDAAVKAWFENEIVAGRQPFAKRMRAAIEATHDIKGAA